MRGIYRPPDCAEFIIGRAFGAARWLHPGYGLRRIMSFAASTPPPAIKIAERTKAVLAVA